MDVCERTRAKASIFLGDGARPSGWIEDPCAQGVEPCRSAGIGGAVLRRRVLRGRWSAGGGARARAPRSAAWATVPRATPRSTGEGVWTGISVDFCRALAAAVLGSKDAVKFRAVLPSERFAALQSGEIDVLSRNVAMTSSHDTALGIRFPGVLVFDGQGFMVRKVARRRQRARAVGRAHLRDGGDGRRAGRRRLLRRAQDALRARRSSTSGRTRSRPTPTRAARCCPPTSPCWRWRASSLPIPTSTSSCPRSPPGSWSGRRCGRATRTGSASCAGRSMR